MTGTRRYGHRADEPCGSWVPTTPGRPVAWVGPRHTCARRYHPDNNIHLTPDGAYWWCTGDRSAHPTDTDPPPDVNPTTPANGGAGDTVCTAPGVHHCPAHQRWAHHTHPDQGGRS